MGKIEEAQQILKQMGLPAPQQNEMSALTLLALCGLGPDDSWRDANKDSLGVSKGIMVFMEKHYGKRYAANTRETVRRQVLHQFVQAKLVDYNPDEPDLPTNSPRAHYALTDNALSTIRSYGTPNWKKASKLFVKTHGSLRDKYSKRTSRRPVPVGLPSGKTLELSPGAHNIVQAAVVERFIPRFAQGAQ